MLKYVDSFWILISFTIFFSDCSKESSQITLEKDLIIRKTCTVKKQFYQIENKGLVDEGAVIITGDDLEIDFNGAMLSGASQDMQPNEFTGLGIEIREGKNITLKNLRVRGFKIGLMAKSINNLQLINCDFSYNYREELSTLSNPLDLTQQLSERITPEMILENGIAIYLENCNKALLRESRITNGQNGLLLNECQSALCFNNEIQYNSGLGIALFSSEANRIMHNKLDWNVGGNPQTNYHATFLSGGLWSDEKSRGNQFAYNSVTHSGEGLSYWINSIVDSTNIFYQNDFSYATGTAIDSTFTNKPISPLVQGMNTELGSRVLKGTSYILMQQWGPYNFSFPEIYLREVDDQETHVYLLMGPRGNWKAAGGSGFQSLNPKSGTFPATLRAQPLEDADTLEIKLEFIGEAFLDQFGFENKKGVSYPFKTLLIKDNNNEQISPQ